MPAPSRVMFVYWGRRGLTQFALNVASAAVADPAYDATVSVARQNEAFARFEPFGPALFPVDTFSGNSGALTGAWRLPALRRQLLARLRRDRTEAVIELIPHVWSPFVMPAVRAAGVRYATIVHDASTHPGDYRTGIVKGLIDRSLRGADAVFALSGAVADRFADTGQVPRGKIVTLFHPDLNFSPQPPVPRRAPAAGAPLRLLWMGRIMPYKGLGLFLDAVGLLRRDGLAVEIGVFGEGALGANADRLSAMRAAYGASAAEVVNRWLTDAEIAAVLPRFHAMVLSHTEASQSGVAATALGAGLPAVTTPVGGLAGQIPDGVAGVVAEAADAPALAAAIRRLLLDPALYERVCGHIERSRDARSVARFAAECVRHAVGGSG